MMLNAILAIILSSQFVFLALGIAVITYVVRTIVDYAIMDNPKLPGNRKSLAWRSLILPLMPIGFGIGFWGITLKYLYTYPDGVNTDTSRFMFCLAAGALSGVVFKVIKELLLANITQPNTNPYNPYNPIPPYINQGPIPMPNPNPVILPAPTPYIPPAVQNINNGHGVNEMTEKNK